MNFPAPKAVMISIAAAAPWPVWIMSYHLRPSGSASSSGLPASRSGKKPILSEWSVTTRKSSGRDSFGRLAGGRGDLLALGKAIGVGRRRAARRKRRHPSKTMCGCGCRRTAAGSGSCGRHRANRAACAGNSFSAVAASSIADVRVHGFLRRGLQGARGDHEMASAELRRSADFERGRRHVRSSRFAAVRRPRMTSLSDRASVIPTLAAAHPAVRRPRTPPSCRSRRPTRRRPGAGW